MKRWKLPGELLILKNITFGSKSPWRVLNAPFHWSSSLMWILLYPHHMSNLLNSSIPCKSSIHCVLRSGSDPIYFSFTLPSFPVTWPWASPYLLTWLTSHGRSPDRSLDPVITWSPHCSNRLLFYCSNHPLFTFSIVPALLFLTSLFSKGHCSPP